MNQDKHLIDMTLYEIIKKLVGPINPVGDASVDPRRLKNLKEIIALTDSLIGDIDDMAYVNRDCKEYSIKEAVKCANKFLEQIKD